MYEITYYTDVEIGLTEIAQIAEEAGYRVREQGDKEQYIYLSTDDNFSPMEEVVRCYLPTGKIQIISRRMKRLEKLHIQPKTMLYIESKHFALSHLVSLLRIVLGKYGGCVETNMSYEMFTLKEVDKLLSLSDDSFKQDNS